MSKGDITRIMKKLEEHEERITQIEKILMEKKEKLMEVDSFEKRLEKFSKDVRVTREQLMFVFDFGKEKNDLRLLINFKNLKESEKQLKAALCILTGYHYCYEIDEIKSKDLHSKLGWLDIRSLGNLTINLKRYKKFIVTKGKSGSREFTYRITYPGIQEGLRIIKESIEI